MTRRTRAVGISAVSALRRDVGGRLWRITAALEGVRRGGTVGRSGPAPGAGLLSLAFLILAAVWTKARGFLAR